MVLNEAVETVYFRCWLTNILFDLMCVIIQCDLLLHWYNFNENSYLIFKKEKKQLFLPFFF